MMMMYNLFVTYNIYCSGKERPWCFLVVVRCSNILITAACKTDSILLPKCLTERAHRALLAKLQFCQPWVTCLGYTLENGLSHQSKAAVGSASTHEGGDAFLHRHDQLLLNPLNGLKVWHLHSETWRQLISATALGLPEYNLPFHVYVHETNGFSSGILVKKHVSHYCPVAFCSSKLPPVLTEKSAHIAMGSKCQVFAPHYSIQVYHFCSQSPTFKSSYLDPIGLLEWWAN